MATLPATAATCNVVGSVEAPHFLPIVAQPDPLRDSLVEANALLRGFMDALPDFDEFDNLARAEFAVERFERLVTPAAELAKRTVTPDLAVIAAPTVVDYVSAPDILRSAVADAIPLLRPLIEQIDQWQDYEDCREGSAALDRLELLSTPIPAIPAGHDTPLPTITPAQVVDEMATAHAWYTDADATEPKVQEWWANAPDDAEKRRTALRVSRQLVLANSPIGRAAAHIADLADKLDDAISDFNAVDVRGCVAHALGAAGLLDDGPDEDSWQRNTFDVFSEVARGYAYLIGQVAAEFHQTGGRLGEVEATGVELVWRKAADAA